jgi:hypothetical protein
MNASPASPQSANMKAMRSLVYVWTSKKIEQQKVIARYDEGGSRKQAQVLLLLKQMIVLIID